MSTEDFKTKSVSVFKNGTAFFAKHVTIQQPPKNGRFQIHGDQVPQAKFGTLWFSDDKGTLKGVGSLVDHAVAHKKIATTIPEIIRANRGKQAEIWIEGIDEPFAQATIESDEDDDGNGEEDLVHNSPVCTGGFHTVTVPQGVRPGDNFFVSVNGQRVSVQCPGTARAGSSIKIRIPNPHHQPSSNLVHFSVDKKWHTVKAEDIQRVVFLERPKKYTVEMKSKRVLNLDFGHDMKNNENTEHKLDIMYLRDDLGWTPTYSIELITDDKAIITLRATVLNDAEDINDTIMNFVVGVPNFPTSSPLSPLCDLNSNVSNFLNGIECMGNQMQQSRELRYESYSIDSSSGYARMSSNPEGIGSSGEGISDNEDLFHYTAESVSLKKGERSFINLLKSECDVEHSYEIQLTADRELSTDGSFHFSNDNVDQVYHSIKLTNLSDEPWTTGMAMVTCRDSDNNACHKPIGQYKLAFTPSQGEIRLLLSTAPDITVQHAEMEASRTKCSDDSPSTTGPNFTYHSVRVKGRIELKNYKKKNVLVRIRRKVMGEIILNNDDDDMKRRTKSKLPSLTKRKKTTRNNSNQKVTVSKASIRTQAGRAFTDMCWEVYLDAGAEDAVEYQYQSQMKVFSK